MNSQKMEYGAKELRNLRNANIGPISFLWKYLSKRFS
jgi:hypothetical protein